MSALDSLKSMTTVVIDTGNFNAIKELKPQDATTNPSLLFQAFQMPEYSKIVDAAIQYGRDNYSGQPDGGGADGGDVMLKKAQLAMDKLAVDFGCEILKIVPGRVSTEVDARLSFDAEGSVSKARALIALYKAAGVDKDRVLIKLASTWQGCVAAKQLESEGIHVNMTLIFNKMQAAAAAEANATLISPFVGRITDFFKAKEGVSSYSPEDDPGVKNVRSIYNYLKHHKYETVVMGASFRNVDQIRALSGCDLLTVSPALLAELAKADGPLPRCLDPAKVTPEPKLDTSESSFLWELNEDEMAHEKLADGIRKFTDDLRKLEGAILARI